MSTDIVQIDPKKYGLEASEAKTIEAAFKPMIEKMTELEDQFNEVVSLEVSPATCEKARRLRLAYLSVRTGTAKIHKTAKHYYLAGGKFVDGWKNAQAFASAGKEEALRAIEEHYDRIEQARIAKLAEDRAALLEPYGTDPTYIDLGAMPDDVWRNYLAGTKLRHEQRLEAERQAEADRLAAIAAEKERQRVQAEENERLKAEAEAREEEIAKERKRAQDKQKRLEKEAKKARDAAEAKLKKEREAAQKAKREAEEAAAKEQRRIQAEADAKLKAEREGRKRVERELQAKRDAEAKAEAVRIAAEEAEKAKGEADRFADFVSDLDALTTKYSFKSKTYKAPYEKAVVGIRSIITDIQELVEEEVW